MTSGSPITTASKAPSSFLDLPVELKTEILSYLPFTEIRESRRVCKNLRDIVDEKSNIMTLYEPGQERDRDRLNDAVASFLDLKGVGFLDALARWVGQRGICPDFEMRHILIEALVREWIKQQGIDGSRPELARDRVVLTYFANEYINAHVYAHLDEEGYEIIWGNSSSPELWNSWPRVLQRLGLYGISEDMLAEWDNEVRQDSRKLAAPAMVPRPDYTLTRLDYFVPLWESWDEDSETSDEDSDSGDEDLGDFHDLDYRKVEDRGLCSSERLAELFGLRVLPESCRHFAFCVKTKRAYDIVEQAVDGAQIREQDKAFVLEDMYLF
ncbi:uncharacterized protein MYCFIDRAFT_193795 [Pseudocercospora fijiensis CIRAD86]|uniref:F-box domain-containing protein n=1 Tax=Pseudocercospora fijiensis (strain CIRAD86) TaxID=383855 RepID=M3B857_PSEFD|nr:uncharacterized protein MYCFIDRAFT_193795 [Pseudocercospora fijiensis CIRAD86]EME85503.1 hypothetical protein MYCFIDRAFT_193795 [Pseudocercospora fijiensis CIRAD86]